MKLIFIDGPTKDLDYIKDQWQEQNPDTRVFIVTNDKGYSKMMLKFQTIADGFCFKEKVVLTNEVFLLDALPPNEDGDKVTIPYYDAYFYHKKKGFLRLHDFYPNIRIVNNIGKMYRAHIFDEYIK